ncbi:hypothetical protein [Amycolatopsis sp. cmx-11-51]
MTQTRNANRQARVAANKIRYTVITLQQPQHATPNSRVGNR